MNTIIRKSQLVTMKSFDNLFIEMTSKYCNQKCANCYIDFPQFKKVEDFIEIETIEQAMSDIQNMNIKCIYLTGAEPMTHPHFNSILRLCLRKTNVCICTNGSFINEKKARFLKKVEEESKNEIIFRISFDHYDEIKNDNSRYRGAYRHASFAIKHLVKYNFTPVICVTNFYNEDEKIITEKFLEKFCQWGMDASHIIVNPWYDCKKSDENEEVNEEWNRLECEYGRTLTAKGVYVCPFLSNDYRGRSGSTFKDFSGTTPLETSYCETCKQCSHEMFGINFNNFK